jgi:hypothetical protein
MGFNSAFKGLMRILYIYVANQQIHTDKICFIIYSGFIMMMVAEAIETCRRILMYGKAWYIICVLLLVGYGSVN